MSYYGRSAESAALRDCAAKMRMPTGELFETNMRRYALDCIASLNDQRKAKNTKTGLIRVWPHYGDRDVNDKHQGTDLKLIDYSGRIAAYAGHLRIDFTHSFAKKLPDCMPILATPREPIRIAGMDLKFGVRVGNKAALFREPAIVVGIDGTPSQVKNLEERGGMAAFRGSMYPIIRTAGQTLQQFMLYADADYRSFAEAHKLKAPEVDLSVNPKSRAQAINMAHQRKFRDQMLAYHVRNIVPSAGLEPHMDGTPSATPWLDKVNAGMAEADEAEKAAQADYDARHGYR